MSARNVLFVILSGLGASACGADDAAPADSAPPADAGDTRDADAAADAVDPRATACCPVGNCSDSKNECVVGACVPKKADADACYLDGECRDGKVCQGASYCACGALDCSAVAGRCAYPSGCCNGDGDCAGGEVCEAGTCRAKPNQGCWRDSHCPEGELCQGARPNACGQAGADVPGVCAVAGVCCGGDAECGSGGACRGGRCVAQPSGGACWGDDDCAGGTMCLGASLCECTPGAGDSGSCAVPPAAGRCGVAADSCCAKDSECGAGELCVAGECGRMPVRALDECWVDDHCGAGRVCEGATLCGCNEDGCMESVIGQCRTLMTECAADGSCPVGMRCIAPDALDCSSLEDQVGDSTPGEAPLELRLCVPEVDVGCWEKTDCAADERCGSEVVCHDAAGCDVPNKPGACLPPVKRWDCCDSHNECADGFQCRNQDSSLTCPPSSSAVCLNEATFGESCWNRDDCPAGLSCYRVWICGCNGKCYWNHMGNCEPPTGCQTNQDCGQGYVCARDPECFLSPCTTAATCTSGGQCQVKVEGGCWTHDECGDGKYCEGLKICPPDTGCTVPDQPGICADRAGLGECCTSFKGCQPGLRCLSPAQRSGCKIDHTAVCVPAVTPGASCFGDEDCDAQQRCEGAMVCPCGVETCTDAPRAGSCVAR